jgi:MoxR-like ATPase
MPARADGAVNSGKVPPMQRPLQPLLARLVDQVDSIIVGKRDRIEDCVACLVAGGHLLIEDVPGVGKTTLAQALALSLGLRFARVQFTSDLMPSDLVGVSVFERSREAFVFHPGPVFTQVLLADEINRAGPRTQSALLEAMEERQVSVDHATHALPSPFFVVATQNPADHLGTHPLPESQLDRFLMRITLGYPDRQAERALLAGEDRRAALARLAPVMTPAELQQAQAAARGVSVSGALLDYLQALVEATRSGRWFAQGLSPRAALAVLSAARARAFMAGRDYVAPDDLQALLPQTIAHRLVPASGAGRGAREQVLAMVEATPLP